MGHPGAMRSIEPGISRFRVRSCGPSRNDEFNRYLVARGKFFPNAAAIAEISGFMK
jgi:hypothetical protein